MAGRQPALCRIPTQLIGLWQEGILVMDRCSYIKRGLCVTVWSPNEWNNESSKKVTKLKNGWVASTCHHLSEILSALVRSHRAWLWGLRVAWLVQDWDSMKNVLLKDDLIFYLFRCQSPCHCRLHPRDDLWGSKNWLFTTIPIYTPV